MRRKKTSSTEVLGNLIVLSAIGSLPMFFGLIGLVISLVLFLVVIMSE